jgi:hypothetical protein
MADHCLHTSQNLGDTSSKPGIYRMSHKSYCTGKLSYLQCSKRVCIHRYTIPELIFVPEFHTGTYQYIVHTFIFLFVSVMVYTFLVLTCIPALLTSISSAGYLATYGRNVKKQKFLKIMFQVPSVGLFYLGQSYIMNSNTLRPCCNANITANGE